MKMLESRKKTPSTCISPDKSEMFHFHRTELHTDTDIKFSDGFFQNV